LLFVLACACAVLALALTEGGLIQGAAPGAPAPAVTIDVEEPELSPTLPAESPTETEVVPQPTPTSGGEGIEVPPGQSPEEPVEIQTQPPQGGSGE
jgi:hypothetical protein